MPDVVARSCGKDITGVNNAIKVITAVGTAKAFQRLASYDFLNSGINNYHVTVWYSSHKEDTSNKPHGMVQDRCEIVLTALVYEKQQNLRIMMKMHGPGDGPYLMISYAYFLVIYVAYIVCFVVFGSAVVIVISSDEEYSSDDEKYDIPEDDIVPAVPTIPASHWDDVIVNSSDEEPKMPAKRVSVKSRKRVFALIDESDSDEEYWSNAFLF
ncbi:ABC transporter A, ABCA [Tanacetum coccineum]